MCCAVRPWSTRGFTLNFTDEKGTDPATGKPWHESWCYQNGIADYVAEVAGEDTLTPVFSCESEAVGRDRADQPDYKVRMSAAFCFSNKVQLLEALPQLLVAGARRQPTEQRGADRLCLPDRRNLPEGKEPVQKR